MQRRVGHDDEKYHASWVYSYDRGLPLSASMPLSLPKESVAHSATISLSPQSMPHAEAPALLTIFTCLVEKHQIFGKQTFLTMHN